MELTIKINMDGAAFEENGEADEVATILNNLAAQWYRLSRDGKMALLDSNGNTVGKAEITE